MSLSIKDSLLQAVALLRNDKGQESVLEYLMRIYHGREKTSGEKARYDALRGQFEDELEFLSEDIPLNGIALMGLGIRILLRENWETC